MNAVAELPKRQWIPGWEIPEKYGKFHPPPSQRVYAFKPKRGVLVTLQADAFPVKDNPLDGQRPLAWKVKPETVQNPQKWITLTYDQAVRAVEICRERDWPVKKGVAAVIDTDHFTKVQLAKLASAPESFPVHRNASPASVVEEPKFDAVTADFFASAQKATAPAAPVATKTAAKPEAAKVG